METPEEQLAGFIAKFSPEVAEQTHEALAKMRARLPGAIELVYDNYNALAIGFGPSEKTSAAIFSIAVYPRWVSLFFLKGAGLPDSERLLKGSGNVCRHIVLSDVGILDDPAVQNLMALAMVQEADPIDPTQPGRIVIKSISAKQRQRRL
jgi:hypothetical protein